MEEHKLSKMCLSMISMIKCSIVIIYVVVMSNFSNSDFDDIFKLSL